MLPCRMCPVQVRRDRPQVATSRPARLRSPASAHAARLPDIASTPMGNGSPEVFVARDVHGGSIPSPTTSEVGTSPAAEGVLGGDAAPMAAAPPTQLGEAALASQSIDIDIENATAIPGPVASSDAPALRAAEAAASSDARELAMTAVNDSLEISGPASEDAAPQTEAAAAGPSEDVAPQAEAAAAGTSEDIATLAEGAAAFPSEDVAPQAEAATAGPSEEAGACAIPLDSQPSELPDAAEDHTFESEAPPPPPAAAAAAAMGNPVVEEARQLNDSCSADSGGFPMHAGICLGHVEENALLFGLYLGASLIT